MLGENAACTAADDIQKKKYVGPELDDGDEYSDNECVVADSVSKEDSEKRTDANDVCGNAKDLTEEKKTLYDPEKIDTMNPLPAENEDDLLGNQSEVAASDLDLDEHQENKLLGEDNGNQTEANKSSRPTSDEHTVMNMLMVKKMNTVKEMRVDQVITVMTVKKEMIMLMKTMDLVEMQ